MERHYRYQELRHEQESISADPNVKYQLLVEDSQYDLAKTVSAIQKLATVDQADVLISLWDTADAIAPIADQINKLHTAIRWNNNIAKQYRNTFTFESTYQTWSEQFLQLLHQKGIKKVAILHHESNGWDLALSVFESQAAQYGIELISIQRYLPGERDFRSIVLKALSKKPDAILINDAGENLELIAKQVRSIKPTQFISGYLGYPIDYTLFEGAEFISQLSTSPEFEQRFQKTYGEKMYVRAQLAYDMIMLIGRAYSEFKLKPSTAEIVDRLRAQKSFNGASGLIQNIDGKTFSTTCQKMQILNGQVVASK